MKTVFSAAVLATAAMATRDTTMEARFFDWMKEFGKEFPQNELFERYATFSDNVAKIEAHNAGDATFTMAVNEFADLTADEFKAAFYGYIPRTRSFGTPFEAPEGFAPEDEVDWRTKGVVTPVKDQAQCGSCWAFSTTGSVEAATAISTGNLVSLSEQQLVDCAGSSGNQGCNGGLMDDAFEWIESKGGLCTEADYPYTARNGMCKKSCTPVSPISNHKDVGHSTASLEAAVAQQPVSIAIEADQSSFQFYKSGVLTSGCGKQLDHGVLAVGYGTEGSQDYWIVKNSWGASWGEDGYIRIGRGSDLCGIHDAASYPIV